MEFMYAESQISPTYPIFLSMRSELSTHSFLFLFFLGPPSSDINFLLIVPAAFPTQFLLTHDTSYRKCRRKLLPLVPMLRNTPALPSKPIDYLAKATRLIIQPALQQAVVIRRTQRRDTLRPPDGRKDIPCRIESVLCERVMVL